MNQRFAEVADIEQGEIEYTLQQYESGKHVRLDGEWDFYPNQLVSPQEIEDLSSTSIQVPNNWKEYLQNDENDSNGMGTYHLKINLNNLADKSFGLYFIDVFSAMKVYVDGDLIGENGRISKNKLNMRGTTKPLLLNFQSDKDEIDLVIQVANQEMPNYGGILKSVRFGSEESIYKFSNTFSVIEYFFIALLIMHLLYGLLFIATGRRKKEFFYYIAFIFSQIVVFFFSGLQPILSFFDLSLLAIQTINIIAYLGISLFSLLIFQALFPKSFSGFVYKVLIGLHLFLMIITIIAPLKITLSLLSISISLSIVNYSYITYVNIRERFYHEQYYRVLIFINISMLFGLVWNVIFNISNVTLAYYPIEIIFVIIGFTYLLFKLGIVEAEQDRKQTEELQKVSEMKNLFALITTHELRNPIQMILNIAHQSLLNEELSLQEQRQLSLMIYMGRKMNFILDDLQDISNIYEKKFELDKTTFCLNNFISSIHTLFHYNILNENVTLEIDIDEEIKHIYADENRLYQAIFNLLYTLMKDKEEGTVTITAKEEENGAVISMQDETTVLDQSIIDHIFLPNEKLEIEKLNEFDSLRLFIARYIIEMHQGNLEITSNQMIGTRICFKIPLSTSQAAEVDESKFIHNVENISVLMKHYTEDQVTEKPDMLHTVIKGSKIILVDSDIEFRQVIENVLSKNYDVTSMSSGEEALDLLAEEEYDLVISDVILPGMSGVDLTREIRKRHSLSELPIILITSRSFENDKYKGYLAGVNEFIVKPVDTLELVSKVHVMTALKYSVKKRLNYEAAWQQAQIKPHFLFNTLSSIISLSYID